MCVCVCVNSFENIIKYILWTFYCQLPSGWVQFAALHNKNWLHFGHSHFHFHFIICRSICRHLPPSPSPFTPWTHFNLSIMLWSVSPALLSLSVCLQHMSRPLGSGCGLLCLSVCLSPNWWFDCGRNSLPQGCTINAGAVSLTHSHTHTRQSYSHMSLEHQQPLTRNLLFSLPAPSPSVHKMCTRNSAELSIWAFGNNFIGKQMRLLATQLLHASHHRLHHTPPTLPSSHVPAPLAAFFATPSALHIEALSKLCVAACAKRAATCKLRPAPCLPSSAPSLSHSLLSCL